MVCHMLFRYESVKKWMLEERRLWWLGKVENYGGIGYLNFFPKEILDWRFYCCGMPDIASDLIVFARDWCIVYCVAVIHND